MSTPFDTIAPVYDQLWNSPQRGHVWSVIDSCFRPGDRVLDLGCGTGDDALHLAERGVDVVGIDAAEKMIDVAVSRGVTARRLGIEDLAVLSERFSGAISNFGALNCIVDLCPVAAQLARLVRPGGIVAICIMGRFAWGETLASVSKWEWGKAARRWSGRAVWRGMDVFYHSSQYVRAAFESEFTFDRRVSIGHGDHQLYIFRRRLGCSPRDALAWQPVGGGKTPRGLKPTLRGQFLQDYRAIRSAEGRGSSDSDYYRALPFADLTGRNSAQWQIRARTFDYFHRHLLPRRSCDIADLGAGNCWLSYRLSELRHRPVAVDIFNDPMDGLRAARHYPTRFPAIEAEFDSLPFTSQSFDLVVFNSSFHYSSDYARTLAEARRCLRGGGRVVILDTPIYKRQEHGEAMRRERGPDRSHALGSIEYLDLQMLQDLAHELRITWKTYKPWYGWSWHLRPLRARLRRRRPPSRFWILVGEFQ
jgi:ubiquinone/menaquinone biosynthesis C-methylase UbiE